MTSDHQASPSYDDYHAYQLARLLSEVLGCGELIRYQIHSRPESPTMSPSGEVQGEQTG